ncbi:hypothetical protein K431DRAFT_278636 [Polychaeton citri CBS 116435]|uniref:Endoplasmic reticulum lectin n=1 Tax=Polychaeton citri CBS 116435 TaxID=1314669 RepID=A0A9P4PZA5_9PEZI|nr:hypothetical protein K431DRAFT_278636 [Polychaeton citri CBS 116435]
MKHFLALPAVLRASLFLVAASHHGFSVHDDLLAFPQYEIQFEEDYVSEQHAQTKLQVQLSNEGEAAYSDDAGADVQAYNAQYGEGRVGEDGGKEDESGNYSYESLVLDGQKYLCSIPRILKQDSSDSGNETAQTKAEEDRELERANDRGWELLQGMQGNCVYFISGWWSYRFCFKGGVKQFHQLPPGRGIQPFPPVEDPGVEAYMLGQFKDSNKDARDRPVGDDGSGDGSLNVGRSRETHHSAIGELVQRGETRYLVQKLEGGTVCDLTGKDRKIEIQFHCNPNTPDRISLIKETSTCTYLMIIQTPRLCSDVAFLPPQRDQPNRISCRPILGSSEDIQQYEQDLQQIKKEDEEAEIWLEHNDAAQAFGVEFGKTAPLVVGGIEIGGHRVVPEDSQIEKSAIVGGGKETYVDTIANSAGKVLSPEKLKELGLINEEDVQKLRKQLEEVAKGATWKLDVIDTPRGREYRGIIGDDDDKDEDSVDGRKEKAEGAEKVKKGKKQKDTYRKEL